MLIRRAEISDIPDILRLLVQVCNVHQDIRPDIFKRDGVKYTESDLRELLTDEGRPVWCAVEDDCFLGYCFCQWKEYRDSSVSTDRKELYIDDLCVDEAARGKGVATELFRYVTAVAKSEGTNFITLNVWEGNSARCFYDKMGMKPRKTTLELPLEETVC
ncbi:MAG: GNAT family N-acetyltransferase [Oscillospiraceae bacterium]|nr:GNAT family N-acetyltransferase [Oscillospiraceae bacterium]